MNIGIYARRSYTSERSESVAMQVSTCRDYIERLFPEDLAGAVAYEDDGYVRSNIDRPAMNRLREDVADGLIDCVVIYKIDRICSGMMDFCTFYTFLKDKGVKFVTVKDGIDTTTPIGEAMMYLAVIFSGIEVSNDSLRITDNLRHIAGAGYWCGGSAPLGYAIQTVSVGPKTHKILVPEPEGLAYKQMIVDLFLSRRYSIKRLETHLRHEGVRTPQGNFCSASYLWRLLSSPMCVEDTPEVYDYFSGLGCIMDDAGPREKWDGKHGVIVYGRTGMRCVNGRRRQVRMPAENWRVSIGAHVPTMPARTWLDIQRQFGAHEFDRAMHYDTSLLKGVLRCSCGRLLSITRKHKKDGSLSAWYRCPRRTQEGKEACSLPQTSADRLDGQVLDIFRRIEHDPALINKYIERPAVPDAARASRTAKRLQANASRIERLTAVLGDAEDSTAAKYIVAQIEKLDEEQGRLRREQAEAAIGLRRAAADAADAARKVEEIRRLVSDFDSFTAAERNEIARAVVKSAVWDGETLSLTL